MHSIIIIFMFIDFYYQIACEMDIGFIISFFLDDWCLMKVHPARDFDNKFSTSVRKNHFGTKKITCNFALCMK